jgi:hypothetical protein
MSDHLSRRQFMRTASAAALAGLAAPALLAQVQQQTVIAFVGVAHIHTPGFVNLI